MPSPVPTPVAAALGLVPTVLSGVRRLPGRAVQLPVLAVSSALNALDTARREYDDLADRGERLLARLRGTSFDEVEDAVEDRLAGTPLEKAYDVAEDAVEDAVELVQETGEKLADQAGKVAGTARDAAGATAEAGTDVLERTTAAVQEQLPSEAESPKGAPTPRATEPDMTRIDTAASADVVETVEQIVAATTAPPVEHRSELPLADYDHMTLGSLRGRLRSLTVPELVQVREYEKEHADRLPVVTMLDNRIAKLATDASASPSAGGEAVEPSTAHDASGKVAPAAPPSSTPPRGKVRLT